VLLLAVNIERQTEVKVDARTDKETDEQSVVSLLHTYMHPLYFGQMSHSTTDHKQ